MDLNVFTQRHQGEINHALPFLPSRAHRWEWRMQFAKAAASELNETHSLRETWHLCRLEWQERRRVRSIIGPLARDIADSGLLRGGGMVPERIIILEYNAAKRRVRIATSRFIDGQSLVFTDHGVFTDLNEHDRITRPAGIETCRVLVGLIERHDDRLTGKLKVYGADSDLPQLTFVPS